MKWDTKTTYAPRYWKLGRILGHIHGLAFAIKKSERGSKEWYIRRLERELEQIKKHVIFLQQTLDNFRKI